VGLSIDHVRAQRHSWSNPLIPILRYGISNAPGNIEGIDADRTKRSRPRPAPKAWKGGLAEDLPPERVHSHPRQSDCFVDFTSDSLRWVISAHTLFGSNPRRLAIRNFLIIKGNRMSRYIRMRTSSLYTTTGFRYVAKEFTHLRKKKRNKSPSAQTAPDDRGPNLLRCQKKKPSPPPPPPPETPTLPPPFPLPIASGHREHNDCSLTSLYGSACRDRNAICNFP